MKKGVVFIALSFLILAIFLVASNISSIWGAITTVPVAWVISYLLGALTMFITSKVFGASSKKSHREE